jgi:hypothetical protein
LGGKITLGKKLATSIASLMPFDLTLLFRLIFLLTLSWSYAVPEPVRKV